MSCGVSVVPNNFMLVYTTSGRVKISRDTKKNRKKCKICCHFFIFQIMESGKHSQDKVKNVRQKNSDISNIFDKKP